MKRAVRLSELAARLGAELRGDGELEATGVASLDDLAAGEIGYVAASPRVAAAIATPAAALIVPRKLADHPDLVGRPLLIAADAKLAFARAIAFFHERPYQPTGVSADLVFGAGTEIGVDCSIHPRVTIGAGSRIGDRVTLYPGVVIGDGVEIGADTILHPHVTIYDGTTIGARCRIHSGTVIGADGFSFTPDEEGRQFKLLQIGRVVIEDEVEIGANCCIDRAGFGETRLRRGVKLDNLIQIGHNVEIGENTVIAALAGFSGGTKVGRHCIIAGQIGTNQHITIGDRVIITARTGVTKSVESDRLVGGMMPAMDYQQWRKSQVLYGRLPELFERLRKLEEKS
ncbi:MAG: UDP-3-O-(3-hydroxymyristoyl)glucosamine N-acyltransferase [Acidobacteriota bacterium]